VFTHNATHALNLALYGLLEPGDHVVTTSMEHNSVMRPLRHLEERGVEVTVVACDEAGVASVEAVRAAMRRHTRLLVVTHASNVTGTLMPVQALAALAHEHGAWCLVDASQTVGVVPIDVGALGVDLMAFSGHKGLLGPTGTGGLYIREGIRVAPLMRGGTGSDSAYELQPERLPDAHESGTVNVAGLAGLGAAVRFLLELGVEQVRAHEARLLARFLELAAEVPGLVVYGPRDPARQVGIASFNLAGAVSSEVAAALEEGFGILARAGLHCAPAAHRTIGTFPTGAVRFGFGWFNTLAHVDEAVRALETIGAWAARHALARQHA
jgi:cysteine desulfurase/selenocysteine lyase